METFHVPRRLAGKFLMRIITTDGTQVSAAFEQQFPQLKIRLHFSKE